MRGVYVHIAILRMIKMIWAFLVIIILGWMLADSD